MSLNRAIIMGRMCADPELRRTSSDVAVTSFTLAVDRDFTPKGKEKEVDFINCVAWRNTAEFVQRYFRKGSMTVVSGRIQIRQYEKEGQKHTIAEIVADNVYFGDSKKNSDEASYEAAERAGKYADEADEGELPF